MIKVLFGKAGSGKTTYAKSLENDHTIVLSIDDFFISLFNGCLGEKHHEMEMKMERYALKRALYLDQKGLDVVIDYGFWRKEERDIVREILKDMPYMLILLNAPFQERMKRIELRNQKTDGFILSEEQIKRFDSMFEEPKEEEYYAI